MQFLNRVMWLSFSILLFTVNANAEKIQAVCYWEMRNLDGIVGFNTSNSFTVSLNDIHDKKEIEDTTTKLRILYKDYAVYNTVGKTKYESILGEIQRMLNYPTCLIYPKNIEDIIYLSINQKSANAERITKQKSREYNWPQCPGIIDLQSSYNYVGIDVKTTCY